MAPQEDQTTDGRFVRRVLTVLALVAAALLVWRLTDLWLLLFGSVLIAVMLRALAGAIERRTALSPRWGLATACLVVVVALGLVGWLAGAAVAAQVDELSEQVPLAWQRVQQYLQDNPIGRRLREWVARAGGDGGLSFVKTTASVFGGLADLLLMLFGGIYLAARPEYYREGMLKLFPPAARAPLRDTAIACTRALRLWVQGQFIAMALVGVLVGLGLWLVGLPSALALGLLAGIGEFIPIVGTLLAAVPAVLLALADGTQTTLWTIAVYVVVQQLEGNLIMPLIQQRMVYLPPALTLFALLAFALLFGLLGVLFAAPMTVIVYVAVKKLWIRDQLQTPTELPGER
jgi:predicted PurR-regulated permease PerM